MDTNKRNRYCQTNVTNQVSVCNQLISHFPYYDDTNPLNNKFTVCLSREASKKSKEKKNQTEFPL